MSWLGTARTNFFRVENLEALQESVEPWDIEVEEHHETAGYVTLAFNGEEGDIPTYALVEDEDGDEEEVEFSIQEHVMPYVVEGEVLVVMEAGADKRRYISGFAGAYRRMGDQVKRVTLNLSSIYEKAAESFDVDMDTIAQCRYSDLPDILPALITSDASPKAS